MRRLRIDGRLAVFSDVHGNLPGLEAILADIEARSVAQTLCLGDLVGYGPFPNEVAALIRDRGIPTLMGNYDQGIGFATGDCGCVYKTDEQRAEGAVSLAWTGEVASDETRAYLRSLEARFAIDSSAGEMLAVHGSPRRINEYLFEDRPASAMARMAAENPYRAILFGHTHVPYAREVPRGGAGGIVSASKSAAASGRSTLFVNVGSAGRPKDGDWRVCYAIVDPEGLGSAGPEGLGGAGPEDAGRPAGAGPAVEFVRVAYEYERLAAALAATPLITRFAGPHPST
ncbi:MAG TPA: metallophosphoesterase family protein [Thermoleophilia bacterium]|nr:metallophosphoesterase family protein [Thermoleophilia bacterium]